MKIIHFSPDENATALQRRLALAELGHDVKSVFYTHFQRSKSYPLKIYDSVWRRLGLPREQRDENRRLLTISRSYKPEIVLVEKGLTLHPKTIQTIKKLLPNVIFACHSLDDMMNPGNQSHYYLRSVPLYDVHFTTKKYNVRELLTMGASRVELIGISFSHHIHKPLEVSASDKHYYGSDVSFVGGYELDRALILNEIAAAGINVRVWGNNWRKFRHPHPNLKIEFKPAYGEEYAKVACSSKIMLGFLRKANRDVETTRTVEIPAFGAFLLAERTEEQKKMLVEGSEAEYFKDAEELLHKIDYYLKNDQRRKKIAEEGRKKCLNVSCSYTDRMKSIVDKCAVIAAEKVR